MDEKLYKENCENILIFDISYKTSTGATPLHFRFDKIEGSIKIHDRISYLVLFDYGWFDKISDWIKHFIIEKSGFTDSVNHNFGRIRIDSYSSLLIEKKRLFML